MTERVKYIVVRCAKDIIERKCTAQELAEDYGVTDRTIYRYIKNKLPMIDKKLHKKVVEVMKEVKSENMAEKYKLRNNKNKGEI